MTSEVLYFYLIILYSMSFPVPQIFQPSSLPLSSSLSSSDGNYFTVWLCSQIDTIYKYLTEMITHIAWYPAFLLSVFSENVWD